MTNTTTAGPTLRAWARARKSAFGRWLFARTVSRRAPYFGTIKPQVPRSRAQILSRVDEKTPRRRKSHRHRARARHGQSLRARRRHVHRGHHSRRHALDSARHDHRISREGRDRRHWPPRGSTRPNGPGPKTSACRSRSPTPRQGSRARGHQHVRVAETKPSEGPGSRPPLLYASGQTSRRKKRRLVRDVRPLPCAASLARALRKILPATRSLATGQHAADFPGSVGCHGLDPPRRMELRVDAAARVADGRAVRTPVHPPARLQPRLVLRKLPAPTAGWAPASA